MSVGTAQAEAIPSTLPLEVVMDPYGIEGQPVEPEDLGHNLWYGVQAITVPESRILSGTPDGVAIATTLRGRDRFVSVPPGMVIHAQGYDPRNDMRSRTGNPMDDDGLFLYPPKYVTADGNLAPLEPHPDDGWADAPDEVAFREAGRFDSIGSVFYGDEKPLRVEQRAPVLQGVTTIKADGARQDVGIAVEEQARLDGDMKLTASGQAELRRLLGEEPVEIAGKRPAVIKAAELSVARVAELSLGEQLAGFVAERQREDDRVIGVRRPDVMAHAVKSGLTSGANNNGVGELPRRVPLQVAEPEVPQQTAQPTAEVQPRRSLRSYLAAGAAALTHMIPTGKGRAGQHRASTAGRHRLRPAI